MIENVLCLSAAKGLIMAMERLTVDMGERSYQIMIGFSDLDRLGINLLPLNLSNRICLVTNTTVGKLYGSRVKTILADSGYTVSYYEAPDGEEYKTLQSAAAIYDQMVNAEMERSSAVVALGGGVVGDMAGFAAATYMRGMPLIQVPTTLLAQVDSSVGGKVAVNHPRGKNLIGCFYQPRLVFADLQTLKTLPVREIKSGMAEVIKYGAIWDSVFFTFLEQRLDRILNLEPEALMETVRRSCAIKAEIVSRDEREDGLRAVLNFGHTIGHALESLTDYRVYRHGEAIAAGMAVAASLAVGRGMMNSADRERLVALLSRTGLPVSIPYPARDIMELLSHDKKVFEGRPRFVLPLKIGQAEICSGLEDEEIAAALTACSRQ
jgi:3-dehydroquinate synthase